MSVSHVKPLVLDVLLMTTPGSPDQSRQKLQRSGADCVHSVVREDPAQSFVQIGGTRVPLYLEEE